MSGGGKLVAFTCVDGHGTTLMPCGRCRQLLYEHSAEGMLLETVSGIRTIDEVLPDAFGPRQLAEYQGRALMSAVEAFDAVDLIRAKRDGHELDDRARSTGSSTRTRAATSPTSRCPR